MNNVLAQSRRDAEFFLIRLTPRLCGSARDFFKRLLPWLAPALILGAWQLLATCNLLDITLLPSPLGVARAAWRLSASGELPRHVWVSSQRAFIGFAVGGGIGFALGLANGLSRISEFALDTTIQMVRNLPHLAMLPLVILWFGIGEGAKIFMIATGVFFPLYMNTFHGIRHIDPALIEMGRVYGLDRRRLFWDIILPGAMPAILNGVRYGLGLMWLTLIVAETIAASSGIGYMAMNAREFLQTDVIVLGIVLYALLGKLVDSFVRGLEARLLRWHSNYQPSARERQS